MQMKCVRLIVCASLGLFLLGSLAHAAAAGVRLNYHKIVVDYQTVAAQRADGSVFRAEFAAEIILFDDGRGNGGFGMWELNGPGSLSLYQTVSGKSNGPWFNFKANRLVSGEPIAVAVRTGAPTGTVTFIIDGVNGLQVSFSTRGELSTGCIGDRCTDTLPEFGLISAEPQTVLVQTFTGDYTARFENVALVFSKGKAIGSLVLSSPDGTLQKVRIIGGEVDLGNQAGATAWLRGSTTTSQDAQPLPVLMVINTGDFSEPCRIYDIAGTQVPAHFEAHGRITGLATDPPD